MRVTASGDASAEAALRRAIVSGQGSPSSDSSQRSILDARVNYERELAHLWLETVFWSQLRPAVMAGSDQPKATLFPWLHSTAIVSADEV